MEYVKTFYACFYLLLNSGGTMYARYGCVCQLQRQIRRRFGAAESDILADRRIRIVHTWPHYHLIPNTNMHGKPWRIPCRDCWGMNFKSRFSAAKYSNTASKWLSYNSYFINPCMEYVKTFHSCYYLVLNGDGAMYARRGCVCQLQRQIRRRFGAAESDILADRRIRIVHTWPHYHLNTK